MPRRHAKTMLMVISLAGSAMVAASGHAAAAPNSVPAAPQASAPVEVTLVTGDRVLVGDPVAGHATLTVLPAARQSGHRPSFSVRNDGGESYVIPSDVASLVPGVLDSALFDVTALARMGYDDESRASIPLIVKHAPGVHRLSASPTGLQPHLALPSIGGEAADLAKDKSAAFGRLLTALAAPRHSMTPAAVGAELGGVSRIWLDAPVAAASLDTNLTQISAPVAWDSGLSGSGVKVAVLDTGADTGHPDLAGQISTTANFTTDPNNTDDNGHGTHVASLLAGTGAAADGARRGVAYGAKLIAGKVLDGDGRGQTSWVLAGMQWAVAQGADIVSMSLGGHATSPSIDDPLVQALDSLTESSGTLFVVAAGNTGSSKYTVSSPSDAPSALSVAAVDDTDKTAQFSSRGPTPGDYRLKPDIAAPGVNIVGARAGARAGDMYTTYSGTSQATPQVAGAAALLMQEHPDWSWDRVKTDLIDTADLAFGQNVYDQGGGRLDLARATTETLAAAKPSVDFGLVPWNEMTVRSQQVTLTNDTDTPTTVDLSAATAPVYDGNHTDDATEPVTLSVPQLTIPANGSASFTATLDPTIATIGKLYTGAITVTRGGTAALHLPVAFQTETEHHAVTVTVTDRHGQPYAGGTVDIVSAHDANHESAFDIGLNDQGRATARLVPGWYSVQSRIETPAADGSTESISFAGNPEVHITADAQIALDARDAKPLQAPKIPHVATAVDQAQVWYGRYDEMGGGYTTFDFPSGADVAAGRVLVQPSQPVQHGAFGLMTRWRLVPTGRSHQADLYDLIFETPTVPNPVAYAFTDADVHRLARLDVTYDAVGKKATAAEVRASWTDRVNLAVGADRPVNLPSHRVELVTAAPYTHWEQIITLPGPGQQKFFGPVKSYQQGQRVTETWFHELHPVIVEAPRYAFQQWVETGVGDGEHVRRYGVGHRTASLQLRRDGTVVGERSESFGYFPVFAGPGAFAAEQNITVDPVNDDGPSSSHTTWTFTSTPTTDPAHHPTTIPPIVQLNYRPQVDSYGYARAHLPLVLDLQVEHLLGATAPAGAPHDVTLSYSSDQGAHWHELNLVQLPGGHYVTAIPGSSVRAGVPISVHGTATDSAGNAIDQTVLGMINVK
jgi:subtilisin family serine protease